MKKTEIPVEGLYIIAFLVLMSLAGTSLYFYLESQSTGRDYRIAAGKVLEESESLKMLIDQERQFVLETVLFFLGSQGGVANVQEYNAYNLTKIGDSGSIYDCVQFMKERNNGVYPSPEILSKCVTNPEYYDSPESLGAWKCDNYLYSYEMCTYDHQSPCCAGSENTICHEGCLIALNYDLSTCINKGYCGALWCKENNLEIPESYQGVQYYSKVIDKRPGFFCESIYSLNPELNYSSTIWTDIDSTSILNNLIDLSNKYFYLPYPEFSKYLYQIYKRDLKLTFQLNFKGCNNEMCEFSWVPYGNVKQGFTVKGLNGIPIVELSNEIISLQSIKIPLFDMIQYSKELVETKEITNYFAKELKDQILIYEEPSGADNLPKPSDWNVLLSLKLGVDGRTAAGDDASVKKYDFYDNSTCGDEPYNNNNYECLMQHVSTKLYNTMSDPITVSRTEGYDYNLRPLFNFVKASLGASFKNEYTCKNNICEYGETTNNCPQDCPNQTLISASKGYALRSSTCNNNGRCEFGETTESCMWECPRVELDSGCSGMSCNIPMCYILFGSPDEYNCGEYKQLKECINGLQNVDVDIRESLLASLEDNICASDDIHDYAQNYSCGQKQAVEAKINNDYIDGEAKTGLLNELNSKLCLSDKPAPTEKSFDITVSNDSYKIFVKGSGSAAFNIDIDGETASFQRAGTDDFYEQLKKADDTEGRCAYNYYNNSEIKWLSYYETMGCCPQSNYSNGQCMIAASNNDYCQLINNKNGRSQLGAYCLLNNFQGGMINNTMNNFFIPSGTHTISLTGISGFIEAIDFIRVDYDSTYPATEKTNQGITRIAGGSYEYYSAAKDCSSGMESTVIQASELSKQELWYSMLCLRAQGKNWVNIIENYTAVYDNYKSEFAGDYESNKEKIDSFIRNYDYTREYNLNTKKVVIKFIDCSSEAGDCGKLNLDGVQNTYEYSEPFLSLGSDEVLIERLRQIQKNTSYISLPVKWIFGYNDKVSIDQTNSQINLKDDCDLTYDEEKQPMPDCGCKTNCQENYQCIFDFTGIYPNKLNGQLYDFEAIFVTNNDYRTQGVIFG